MTALLISISPPETSSSWSIPWSPTHLWMSKFLLLAQKMWRWLAIPSCSRSLRKIVRSTSPPSVAASFLSAALGCLSHSHQWSLIKQTGLFETHERQSVLSPRMHSLLLRVRPFSSSELLWSNADQTLQNGAGSFLSPGEVRTRTACTSRCWFVRSNETAEQQCRIPAIECLPVFCCSIYPFPISIHLWMSPLERRVWLPDWFCPHTGEGGRTIDFSWHITLNHPNLFGDTIVQSVRRERLLKH